MKTKISSTHLGATSEHTDRADQSRVLRFLKPFCVALATLILCFIGLQEELWRSAAALLHDGIRPERAYCFANVCVTTLNLSLALTCLS
jgi:hypothetical protein